MMPVWPVARNVASTPRCCIALVSASAVYFLPSAQSVPTVSSRLPRAPSAAADGKALPRQAHVDQCDAALAAAASASPGTSSSGRVHSAHDVETGSDGAMQHRFPFRGNLPADRRDADQHRAGACGAAACPESFRAARDRRGSRQAQLRETSFAAPSRARRRRSWRTRRCPHRRGTADRVCAIRGAHCSSLVLLYRDSGETTMLGARCGEIIHIRGDGQRKPRSNASVRARSAHAAQGVGFGVASGAALRAPVPPLVPTAPTHPATG